MISIIVAASTNHVIGVNGQLPWRLSDDLKHFKAITLDKPIVMGRLTWESLGGPLPRRHNIVITRQDRYHANGCDVVQSPATALQAAGDVAEVMIIGGSQIYDLFLSKATRVYLTRVHTDVEGDAFFPALDDAHWHLTSEERHSANDVNAYAFDFKIYERIDRHRPTI